MLYIISIAHQSTPVLHSYIDRAEFIREQGYSAPNSIVDYDEALEYFTHDLHTAVVVENTDDLTRALAYPDNLHRWAKVRSLASEIDVNTL